MMTFRKINIALIILSLSIFLFLMAWIVIYNLIFPVPNMLDLVPNNITGYFDVYDLHKVLSNVLRSEFMRRVVQSPWWANFKTTGLWNEIDTQFKEFQQFGVDQSLIFRLIGTHSVVGFYLDANQTKIDYILISELDVPTRIALSFGQIKKFISPEFTVTKLKYNGKTITTIKSPQGSYIYTFVGRVGVLSDDEYLVQKTLDAYKNRKNRLSFMPEFKQIDLDLPSTNVSFYANTAKLRDSSKLLERYGFQYKNIPIITNSDMILGIVSQGAGKIRLDSAILHRQIDNSSKPLIKDGLPFPSNCLALTTHRSLNPKALFHWLTKNVSSAFSIIGDDVLPTVSGSIAEAVVSPKSNGNQFPSILLYMQVKSRTLAEAKLYELKYLLRLRDEQIKFTETTYKNAKITYSSYIPGVNFPIGFGYVFIKDDILLMATDEFSIREVLDVLNGDERSFINQSQYADVMSSINGRADEMAFINLREMSPIVEQVSRLYLYQGMFTGNRSGENVATMLADNAFILGSWDYLGAVWNSKDNITNLKLILTREKSSP